MNDFDCQCCFLIHSNLGILNIFKTKKKKKKQDLSIHLENKTSFLYNSTFYLQRSHDGTKSNQSCNTSHLNIYIQSCVFKLPLYVCNFSPLQVYLAIEGKPGSWPVHSPFFTLFFRTAGHRANNSDLFRVLHIYTLFVYGIIASLHLL